MYKDQSPLKFKPQILSGFVVLFHFFLVYLSLLPAVIGLPAHFDRSSLISFTFVLLSCLRIVYLLVLVFVVIASVLLCSIFVLPPTMFLLLAYPGFVFFVLLLDCCLDLYCWI